MEIILGNRGSGKTVELIKACAKDNNGVIVCVTKRSCKYVFETSKRLGYSIFYPISFQDFINENYNGCLFKNFYFDNIDLCLQFYHPNVCVKGITLNKGERNNIKKLNPYKWCNIKTLIKRKFWRKNK